MVQHTSLDDERSVTRSVLAESTTGWRERVFLRALELQAANPAMELSAREAPSGSVEAGERLVALIAMGMHPDAIRQCIAWCEFVESELVTPPVDTERRVIVSVEGGRMHDVGGQQQHDRLAELEAENEELRDQIAQLLRTHETDREHLRSIRTLAALRLEDSID